MQRRTMPADNQPVHHTLLISSEIAVVDGVTLLTNQLRASLTTVKNVPPFVHRDVDLVFWHTVYPFDYNQYKFLRTYYRRVLAVYIRPQGGERIGPIAPVFIPFMLFPFHLEDAVELIQLHLKRSTWLQEENRW